MRADTELALEATTEHLLEAARDNGEGSPEKAIELNRHVRYRAAHPSMDKS